MLPTEVEFSLQQYHPESVFLVKPHPGLQDKNQYINDDIINYF